jgi:hypothetical protein
MTMIERCWLSSRLWLEYANFPSFHHWERLKAKIGAMLATLTDYEVHEKEQPGERESFMRVE